MRMLEKVRDLYPDLPTICVTADTGFEYKKPISPVDWVKMRCSQLRRAVPVTMVRNEKKTYLEMVARRGKSPSAQFRQCTSDLKRGPIERFIRSLPNRVIVNCLGIRAEESHSRSREKAWSLNDALTTRTRSVYNRLPIFEETERDILEWHWRTGTPRRPVYVPEFYKDGTTGGYLRRFSCRLCIFASDKDVAAVAAHDPEAFALVSDLEKRIGFTMKPGTSLVEILEGQVSDKNEDGHQSCFSFCA